MPSKAIIPTVCAHCGAEFLARPACGDEAPRKFCKPACYRAYRHRTPEQFFWERVRKTGTCWLWTGSKQRFGYGQIRFDDGRFWFAHRFSWQLHNGPIPEGLSVLHDCPGGDNPSCVNPAHLWLGTQSENSLDMHAKGRARLDTLRRHGKGEAHAFAKLTEPQVLAARARAAAGERHRSIACDLGVTRALVTAIAARRIWKHLP